MTRTTKEVVGIVLAGGQARRMGGGDKCFLEIGGQSLLARTIDRLSPQVCDLVINANGDAARFASFEHPVAKDTIEGFVGPLAGVLAGMRWAQSHAPDVPFILTAASDTPFFPRDLTQRLLQGAGNGKLSIVLAASNGRVHPVFGLWPVALANDLDEALVSGLRKILDWTDMHKMVEVVFETDAAQIDPFFNVNCPEDLAKAELIAESIL
ncbi:MAG: molybdenum cofactor guanylyltransferase MobA [bacterium]|nr:molybdenum cofactor guanylyltransferase MobA [bacterium]